MKARRLLSSLAAVVVAGAITGCQDAGGAAASPHTVRVHEYPGSTTNMMTWVAIDKGFCESRGITCDGVAIPSGPLALQALSSGSLEVMQSGQEVIMQAKANGNDVAIVSGIYGYHSYVLNVRKGINLPHAAEGYPAVMQDLADKKIGIAARGSTTEIQARALFQGAGIDPNTITWVPVGSPGTAYPTLLSGQVDAVMAWDPMITLCDVLDTCDVAVNMQAGEGPAALIDLTQNCCTQAYAVTSEYAEESSANVEAFRLAMHDAAVWANDPANRPELVDLMEPRLEIPQVPDRRAVVEQLVENNLPLNADLTESGVAAYSQFLVDNEVISEPIDLDEYLYEASS